MGLEIIFALITILSGIGGLRALKDKNFLGAFWGVAAFAVFGWFVVMTVIHHGIPVTEAH